MRLPDGERFDDALDLFHDHQWRAYKPQLGEDQLAELLVVLEPWFREEFAPKRSRVSNRKPAKVASARKDSRPRSSIVPKRVRDATLLRDDNCCQRCGRRLDPWWYSLQHRDARGMGGSRLLHRMANLVALCGNGVDGCHGYVESERIESYALGWLVPNGATPEEWRVWRFGVWMQPGEVWVEAAPSERQRELVVGGGFSAVETNEVETT